MALTQRKKKQPKSRIENFPPMMSVRETADYTGQHLTTVYDQIRAGIFDGCVVRFGASIRIVKSKLDELIAAGGRQKGQAA